MQPSKHVFFDVIEVVQPALENAEDDLGIYLFVSMPEEVSVGSHILKPGQILLRDDLVFHKDGENVPIAYGFAPSVFGNQMVCNI